MPAAKPVDMDEHIERMFSERHKRKQEKIDIQVRYLLFTHCSSYSFWILPK